MSINKIYLVSGVSALPGDWDSAASDYFQTREFLGHIEKYSGSSPKYYIAEDKEGNLAASAAVFEVKKILFPYFKLKPPLKITLCNLPCLVSSSGFSGNPEYYENLLKHIISNEKGVIAGYNLREPSFLMDTLAWESTYPEIIFENSFSDYAEYRDSLKSEYRRRLLKTNEKFYQIRKRKLPCGNFSKEMYGMYMQVFKKNSARYGLLSFEFFRKLPARFELTSFYFENRLAGWHICVMHEECLYFFLGAFDYSLNARFNIYFNIIFDIIKEGISRKAASINLGQTAEIPKIRAAGQSRARYMFVFHRQRCVLEMLKKIRNFWDAKN